MRWNLNESFMDRGLNKYQIIFSRSLDKVYVELMRGFMADSEVFAEMLRTLPAEYVMQYINVDSDAMKESVQEAVWERADVIASEQLWSYPSQYLKDDLRTFVAEKSFVKEVGGKIVFDKDGYDSELDDYYGNGGIEDRTEDEDAEGNAGTWLWNGEIVREAEMELSGEYQAEIRTEIKSDIRKLITTNIESGHTLDTLYKDLTTKSIFRTWSYKTVYDFISTEMILLDAKHLLSGVLAEYTGTLFDGLEW